MKVAEGDKTLVHRAGLPGFQPGRFRLVLGECFVGALSRSFSPRDVRTREALQKGRRAEVQVLTKEGGAIVIIIAMVEIGTESGSNTVRVIKNSCTLMMT